MECRITSRTKRDKAGFTLSELLIASGIALVVATMLAFLYVYHLKAFASLENYMNLNNESRTALDKLTREIRQADGVVFYSGNKFTLSVDGKNVSFSYDPAKKILARTSGSQSNVFLVGCDYWTNNIYDRNLNLIATATNCKVVQLTWICTRSVLGRKINTEDVQSAKIVIRKQKS